MPLRKSKIRIFYIIIVSFGLIFVNGRKLNAADGQPFQTPHSMEKVRLLVHSTSTQKALFYLEYDGGTYFSFAECDILNVDKITSETNDFPEGCQNITKIEDWLEQEDGTTSLVLPLFLRSMLPKHGDVFSDFSKKFEEEMIKNNITQKNERSSWKMVYAGFALGGSTLFLPGLIVGGLKGRRILNRSSKTGFYLGALGSSLVLGLGTIYSVEKFFEYVRMDESSKKLTYLDDGSILHLDEEFSNPQEVYQSLRQGLTRAYLYAAQNLTQQGKNKER